MDNETVKDVRPVPPERRKNHWVHRATPIVALVCIVVFGVALAYVTMRWQRHMTASGQWTADQTKMGMAYGSLATAAAGNDALGYGLLLQIAQDDVSSLESDSAAMSPKGIQQRAGFVKQVQGCLPNSIAAFNVQTPATRVACRQMLVTQCARGWG